MSRLRVVVACLVMCGLIISAGCKKKEEPTQPKKKPEVVQDMNIVKPDDSKDSSK